MKPIVLLIRVIGLTNMPCAGLKRGTTVSRSAAPSPVGISAVSVIKVRKPRHGNDEDLPKAAQIRGGEARA